MNDAKIDMKISNLSLSNIDVSPQKEIKQNRLYKVQARESIEKELWVPFLENYGNLGNREIRKEEKDHA